MSDQEPTTTYVCALCRGTFIAAWSADEAAAEREANFPGLAESAAELVCDDCFKRLPVDDWRREWAADRNVVVGVDRAAPGPDITAMRVVEIFGTHYAISPEFERILRQPMKLEAPIFDFDPPPVRFPIFGADRGLPVIQDRKYSISGTLLDDVGADALLDRIRDAIVEIRLKFKGTPRIVRIPEQWARVKGAAPHYRFWIRSTLDRRKIFGTARGRRRARIQRAREARRR